MIDQPDNGSLQGHRLAAIAVAAAALLAICLAALATSPAGATTVGGQVGATWGTAGTADGQFFNPGLLGVDPTDGSVYTGEESDYQNLSGEQVATQYRIKKLSPTGTYQASVETPRWLNNDPGEERILTMAGIAVDHSAGRLYLVQGCRVSIGSNTCKTYGGVFNARRILAFKTTPESGNLIGAGEFTLPEGSQELYRPQSIAVDPSNHDIVILAENAAGHAVVQRVSSSGVAGSSFVDTEDKLKPLSGGPSAPGPAKAIAVGPTGTTYAVTGGGVPGSENTRAWQLPSSLATVEAVPGFAAAAEAEGWQDKLSSGQRDFMIAPQIAISPDGKTLYWKEEELQDEPEAGEPGIYLVRGFSLESDTTAALYGGGTEGTCEIASKTSAIGVSGENLVVFDFGPETKVAGEAPPYGLKVITFGPTGSGCPIPAAAFTVNGATGGDVSVEKGAQVSVNGMESELVGAGVSEIEWDFGDGSEPKTEAGPSPFFIATHRYQAAGSYQIVLTISLEGGETLTAERTVKVVPGTPQAYFEASSYEPASGASVTFDASLSNDPTGSCNSSGCGPSYALKTYSWDFGDGSTAVTSEPIVQHGFSNSSAAPIGRTVTLTVTSFDGASGTFQGQVSVQGTAAGGGSGSGGGSPSTPPATPATPPAGGGSSGTGGGSKGRHGATTLAQKRAKARKKCKKLKGKARARCMKHANSIGKKKHGKKRHHKRGGKKKPGRGGN